ncbi:MAG TPA: carboxymuconolactone decarboxylase family protein [Dehalococcoidia bacterium]|nr:carboxymuconolactone decarboxylase family protein [Dehalococcoidia bacterium]
MSEQQVRPQRSERFLRGAEVVRQIFPNRETNAALAAPEEIRRDWGAWTLEVAMGDVWSRPGLSLRNRSLITVAALTALHRPEELRLHALGALRNGLSRRQVSEIVMHVAGYAGFPVGVEGMRVLRQAFDSAPDLDPPEVADTAGPALADLPEDRWERARAVLRVLFPQQNRAPLPVPAEITPDWGRWVAMSAFADLWARPGLSLREHSRVVLTVLTVLHLPEELRLHIGVARNIGISREEIAEQIMHLAVYGGFPVAVEAMRVARAVFDAEDGSGEDTATARSAP